LLYLYSGYILYSKKGYLFSIFITFAKVIYPLSIFWLQIRIKKSVNFLPIDSTMKTSQLWFNLLPVLASLITVTLTLLNTVFYIIDNSI
ncbi:hypothetical protein OA324_01280, partial [Prochlorococcus sp. AH-716-O05]|nr:hypothetical protein [Prochlorococcus sp. AH-716-O05]